MINICQLTFSYPQKEQPALQNVSLQVNVGEFVLLTGESGSGKSTLLRCINGLIPHLSGGTLQGQVQVNGLDTVNSGPQQMSQHVGFVFQNPEAQAVLDRVEPEIAFGLENSIAFQQTNRRESRAKQEQIRKEMHSRVTETLALLNILALRERPLTNLSGGERQKAALASALALHPALLLLDEPTSQLDPQATADLLDTLVRLNQEQGYTILLAEHRLERVLPFVSRVVHLTAGQIVVDAPPRQAVASLPLVPPVVALGRVREWEPLPLSVAEAKKFVGKRPLPTPYLAKSTKNSQQPVLAVENVSFAYAQTPILRDVSLTATAGEVTALLGHNGAGKSTLLKCITGLLQPAVGQVSVNGRSYQNRSVADICQEVAYLPQNPDDLLFAETIAEELAITLKNHGQPVQDAAITDFLTQLGLAEQHTAYPRDLSVGQRQRVALGAVTITQPPLILLDEPTRGLDYTAKAALIGIWQSWLAQGKAILLVTHDVELVAQVAHTVVILEAGQVKAAGETAVVLPTQPSFMPQIGRLQAQTDKLRQHN